MAMRRVYEIARERGISSQEALAVLQEAGLDVRTASSSVDEAESERAFKRSTTKLVVTSTPVKRQQSWQPWVSSWCWRYAA